MTRREELGQRADDAVARILARQDADNETAMLRQHLVDLRAAWLACGSVVYGCGTAAEREAADRITTILGRP